MATIGVLGHKDKIIRFAVALSFTLSGYVSVVLRRIFGAGHYAGVALGFRMAQF